eukprot:TRINITY_DN10934_c2_g1_i1.p1 TRINITY_DN10934_c2_g1~~TRINITY_DN10934_c2_g1_i1.p1  ORF type:complete len:473 (-),score=93.82 TRINITY_DN10934_c2_g1_i1:116-1534(-)
MSPPIMAVADVSTVSSDIVLVDSRTLMDANLEITFIVAVKTLLSSEQSLHLLPMRFDLIFEKYMRLGALLLDIPELDFAKSTKNLRQFAKAMEKNGFLSLAAGAGEDQSELNDAATDLVPGFTVTKINYDIIDDIYSDGSVFSAIDIDDEVDLSVGNLTENDVIQRKRAKQMKKMIELENLLAKQQEKADAAERKVHKELIKGIEKEWRRMNVGRGEKYTTMMTQDEAARAKYVETTKGCKAQKMMRVIQRKTLNHRNGAKLALTGGVHARLLALTMGVHRQSTSNANSSSFTEVQNPNLYEGSDADWNRTEDLRRQANWKNSKESDRAAEKQHASTYISKVKRELRELLEVLGFPASKHITDLPRFADLRRGYKKALLVVHPDKEPLENAESVLEAKKDDEKASSKTPILEFQDFQKRYEELLMKFYDVSAEDFTTAVKQLRHAKEKEEQKLEQFCSRKQKSTKSSKSSKS